MIEIITFLIGFIIGYGVASVLLIRKRFIIKVEKEGEVTIEPEDRPKQKMEFSSDMTQKEIEDAERPTGLKSFLTGFAKPAKKEEEEETEA